MGYMCMLCFSNPLHSLPHLPPNLYQPLPFKPHRRTSLPHIIHRPCKLTLPQTLITPRYHARTHAYISPSISLKESIRRRYLTWTGLALLWHLSL